MQHVKQIIPNVLSNIYDQQKAQYMRLFNKFNGDFEKMAKYGHSKRTAQELKDLTVIFGVSLPTGANND